MSKRKSPAVHPYPWIVTVDDDTSLRGEIIIRIKPSKAAIEKLAAAIRVLLNGREEGK